MDIYKWIWSRTTKRPFTYVYRDVYRKFEYCIQLQWFATGVVVFYYFGLKGMVCFWICYTWGYLNGHFFFGTRIREGQGLISKKEA